MAKIVYRNMLPIHFNKPTKQFEETGPRNEYQLATAGLNSWRRHQISHWDFYWVGEYYSINMGEIFLQLILGKAEVFKIIKALLRFQCEGAFTWYSVSLVERGLEALRAHGIKHLINVLDNREPCRSYFPLFITITRMVICSISGLIF